MKALTTSITRTPALMLLALTISTCPSFAVVVQVEFASPTIDRWNYPFAGNPGGNAYAAIFAPLTSGGFDPSFDNRDGQMVIGYNTAAQITPQLGQGRYTVLAATVTLTVETGGAFGYDPTPDSFRAWLPPSDPQYVADSDAGHAVELFGVGFRNGFTAATYGENVAYSPLGSFGKGIRSGFAAAFNGSGQCLDISNNVDARMDPTPFAVGLNDTLIRGQLVPVDTVLQLDLDVSNPDIQRYLRRALHQGVLDLSIASIFPSQQQTTGPYPRFYTKENLAVQFGLVSAATLELTVDISTIPARAGDTNFDGLVNIDDLVKVITQWGPCPCCASDVNFDGVVNIDDLVLVITTWG